MTRLLHIKWNNWHKWHSGFVHIPTQPSSSSLLSLILMYLFKIFLQKGPCTLKKPQKGPCFLFLLKSNCKITASFLPLPSWFSTDLPWEKFKWIIPWAKSKTTILPYKFNLKTETYLDKAWEEWAMVSPHPAFYLPGINLIFSAVAPTFLEGV